MLAKRFEDILHKLGMAGLEHPLFYHAPVGIRFEIGGEEPIYLDRSAAKLKTNPAYVQRALDRAAAIYRALPAMPDLLRIDGYPDEEPAESLLTVIQQRMGLPVPDEQLPAIELDEDGDTHAQVQFYWDLSGITFQPEQLLQEIILGDIGGWSGFVSSVYLTGPGPFLYHLYDDRGLDVLGSSRELLLPLYHQFHGWILEYNLEQIDRVFTADQPQRQKFTIDGRRFSSMAGFYDEVERVFTFGLDRKIGRNLNAFNDILRGGFGRHEYGQPIHIQWLAYEKSVRNLGKENMDTIVEIILDTDHSGHDCMLIDTVGMSTLFLPDLQYHFHDMDPNWVVNHAYNVASYILANDNPIQDGETVDGVENGEMSRELQWKCQYEDALIQPPRGVLDINMGEYAAGQR